MVESSQTLLQHFKAKKSEKNSVALQEARRLVNLYRSLACFGDDFLAEYNKMLLDTKPSVKRLLGTFTGGDEVEDYLEFLQENAHLTKAEVEQNTSQGNFQTKGYLPTPDEDVKSETSNGMVTISKEEWEKMKAQKEALTKQLQSLSNMAKTVQTTVGQSDFDSYSEIIEDSSGGKNNE